MNVDSDNVLLEIGVHTCEEIALINEFGGISNGFGGI
jgi:hypothetical protein